MDLLCGLDGVDQDDAAHPRTALGHSCFTLREHQDVSPRASDIELSGATEYINRSRLVSAYGWLGELWQTLFPAPVGLLSLSGSGLLRWRPAALFAWRRDEINFAVNIYHRT